MPRLARPARRVKSAKRPKHVPLRSATSSAGGRRGGDNDLASENVSKCGFEPKPELVALLTSLHVILHPFVDYRGNVESIDYSSLPR